MLICDIVRFMPKGIDWNDLDTESMPQRHGVYLPGRSRVKVEYFTAGRKSTKFVESIAAITDCHVGADQVDDMLRQRRVLELREQDTVGTLLRDPGCR